MLAFHIARIQKLIAFQNTILAFDMLSWLCDYVHFIVNLYVLSILW